MKRKKIIGLVISVFLVALAGVGFWRWSSIPKEVPYITAKVQKGDVTQIVTATGSLSAVVTVQVGSQVSGTIDKLYADFNTQVKAGQVVARLNQDKFKASVDQAKANLLSAQAGVAKQKVTVEDARRTLERNKESKNAASSRKAIWMHRKPPTMRRLLNSKSTKPKSSKLKRP